MLYENNQIRDLQIAYIGGGSRGWAWGLMTDLAMDPQLSGTVRLYDTNAEAAKQNEIIGNRLSAREDAVGKWKYITCTTLEQALTSCDFVIISILPGTFDDMAVDVHLPERFGIWQSVGDTAGPGGMMRALRTIPMFVTIAQAMRDYSPDAWVINYTNPMSLCIKTLYHIFPEIKAFGCCHEVFGTQKLLKELCERECGISDIDWHDIDVNVMGINHFTWFDRASYRGIDLFPVFEHYTDHHFEEGFTGDNPQHLDSHFLCAHRVKMDLFRKYGLIASAGDRHLAEFMPSTEYLKDPDTVKSWRFALTPVSWRKEDLQQRLARSRRLVSGEEEIQLEHTGEEGVMLIKALCGLGRLISNVNLPNTGGQIPNLPRTAVVETNALFSRDHISPVAAGDLPAPVQTLTLPHVENHERILKAAILKDRALVVQAFEQDPLVKGKCCSHADIQALVNDMIDRTLSDTWGR